MLLKCIGVSKKFGGLQALRNVSLTVDEGSITGLVGPNGSGKTTMLSCISGIHKVDSGRIIFEGEDISNLPIHQISSRGVVKTSQIVQSFPDLTVLQNVLVGIYFGREKNCSRPLDRAKEILEFVGVPPSKFDMKASECNIAELRRIQLAKALATKPKLLLLDELLTGLNPKECEKAIELIRKVRSLGVTILIVEHVMRIIMGLCEKICVLHHGEMIAEGPPEEISDDESVIRIYLGKRYLLRDLNA
ncbi:ABC transporter ATP-binding protein [Candidatus Bathyarchaeota archaeon]|nr:ABC transporter ATP-binding protein [Candidatus Bathyarchaeota archaeon]